MLDQLISAMRPLNFRGKARVMACLIPRNGRRSASIHGYDMELDLSEYIQRMVYLGAFETWETRKFIGYLKPGMTVVDVGANIGYFTLLAAKLVGSSGRVVAVEPSPIAAQQLKVTIQLNRIAQVELLQCGLSSDAGEAWLSDPLPNNYSPTMLGEPNAPGRKVSLRTLDELADTLGLAGIDLLKVDVEGYEAKVFSGACNLLRENRIGAMLCEFNSYWLARGGTTSTAVYRDLLAYGFEDRSGTPLDASAAFYNRFLVHPNCTASQ